MIRIITDSTCDIPREELFAMGVVSLPLTVLFGNEEYKDGIDITANQFYEKLSKTDTLPTTSQLNPGEIADVFEKYVENGDEIIGIFLSSKLSGTCQSAKIAASMVDENKIHIIDSQNVTIGLAAIIKESVKIVSLHNNIDVAVNKIAALIDKVRVIAYVDTLKYLKMGGRLSAASATVGTMLGINPIVSVIDGAVESVGKVRGKKAALKYMLDYTHKHPVDFNYGICFAHSEAQESLQECMEFLKKDLSTDDITVCNIGSVVGTHVGPGAVGIAYIEKK